MSTLSYFLIQGQFEVMLKGGRVCRDTTLWCFRPHVTQNQKWIEDIYITFLIRGPVYHKGCFCTINCRTEKSLKWSSFTATGLACTTGGRRLRMPEKYHNIAQSYLDLVVKKIKLLKRPQLKYRALSQVGSIQLYRNWNAEKNQDIVEIV